METLSKATCDSLHSTILYKGSYSSGMLMSLSLFIQKNYYTTNSHTRTHGPVHKLKITLHISPQKEYLSHSLLFPHAFKNLLCSLLDAPRAQRQSAVCNTGKSEVQVMPGLTQKKKKPGWRGVGGAAWLAQSSWL